MQSELRGWRRRSGDALPLLIGHRGASAHETENTAEAFARAARDGADGVELDVQTCKGGELVVFHDDDLSRLLGVPGRVDGTAFSTLRRTPLVQGGRVPVLEEAIEACGPTLLVNVELKLDGVFDRRVARTVEAAAAAIERCAAAGRVLVSSFNPVAVALWRRRRPDVPAGLLFEAGAPLPLRRAWALSLLRPFSVHPDERLCARDAVERWHAAGYAVATWTVDDPGRLRELAAMGLDAIIANDPGAARRVLEAA
jgi:glycerophosphoryl diester phosphodiesterase